MRRELRGAEAAPGRPRRPLVAQAVGGGFYERPCEEVARHLLGARLVSEVDGARCVAEIVETEAYVGPHDDASHAATRIGRTLRNAAMFGPGGTAYVYRIYGIHWCLNAVTGAEGYPAAVLIRAARPVEGWELIRVRRGHRPDADLLRGPGNLARGLGIDGFLDGHPLEGAPLWIEPGRRVVEGEVRRGPRIGITRAADWPLRFWIADDPWVSRHRRSIPTPEVR
jgi:DNA-3-methyladenine glycosylase